MTTKDKELKLRVTLIKSTNKKLQSHQASVLGLGLRRIGQVVELENTKEVRGMVKKVGYLLKVEEV